MLSLSAEGLTHGEISSHLADVYGAEVSKQTVCTITDYTSAGLRMVWRSRRNTGVDTEPCMPG